MQAELKKKKVLVVRVDRIGDVILSTPVIDALKSHEPETEVHALVQEYTFPVVEHHSGLSKIHIYYPQSKHLGIAGIWRLVSEIRKEKYQTCVVLQASFRVSLALFLSGIRHRIGPYSKWYSYLFFNKGTRQRRSAVEMHEADYNLMLLRKLGIRFASRKFEPRIIVDSEAKKRVDEFLISNKLERNEFIVVHPGMGGSALNWSEGYYVDLISQLSENRIKTVVSGSVKEKNLIDRILTALPESKREEVSIFLGMDSVSGLRDLSALISYCHLFVGPSTGPLHLAVALGKKTVSLFSPIKVQSAIRWGPYTNNEHEKNHSVLVPDVLCGQDFKCLGSKCTFYFCLDRLGVDEVLSSIKRQLESSS